MDTSETSGSGGRTKHSQTHFVGHTVSGPHFFLVDVTFFHRLRRRPYCGHSTTSTPLPVPTYFAWQGFYYMTEDIHSHGMILINRYNDFFIKELKNIFTGDASIEPASSQIASSMPAELTDLASRFIRALAAEASRRHAASPNYGTTPAFATTSQQARADLNSPIIEDWAGRVAGATYLEENLRIPRSTLHRWQRSNEVIALRKGRHRHVFPLAQFVDGRPASGIREILAHIPHPRQAWFWMLHPSHNLDGRTPIELLKRDVVSDVISAAKEYAHTQPSSSISDI